MPCHHPLRAYREPSGITFSSGADLNPLLLPCGHCLGCRMAKALAWSIRCALELQCHRTASIVTLTYDDAHVPPTLRKPHLQSYLKRLRSRMAPHPIRFLGCGEYGDKFGRPHYHVLIFGVSQKDVERQQVPGLRRKPIWRRGSVYTDTVTPAGIAYVCGYVTKKQTFESDHYWTDPVSGKTFKGQKPFRVMSRNPGIAGHAREHYLSWREYAIWQGRKVGVPRYLEEAFKTHASPEVLEAAQAARTANRYQRIMNEQLGYDHRGASARRDHVRLEHSNARRGSTRD